MQKLSQIWFHIRQVSVTHGTPDFQIFKDEYHDKFERSLAML